MGKTMNNKIKLYRLHTHHSYQYALVLLPFRVFYSLKEDGKSPKDVSCSIHDEIPDYITELLHSFANGYNIYLGKYKLMNPLKSGIYFEKGAKFIDVMLENIPIQKGLVAAELITNSSLFGKEESMRGSAIRILLDRNLIKNSATPIHELFHVFQYNYCSFNNMWFMEGLARWGQNITHERQNKPEILPSNKEELEALLHRAHDAEYFWRRLISLSEVPEELFIKSLLEHSTCQASVLEERYASQERYKPNNWTKEEKKSVLNNKYIFSAILDTIGEPFPHANKELKLFLELLKDESASNYDAFNTPQIQRFLKILQHYHKELVHEVEEVLHCDFYDVATKTLEIQTLDCSKMSEYDLDSLNILHHINGELLLASPTIEALNSFNYLKSVTTLSIREMSNLKEINGFNSLETLNALEIATNKNLTTIYGFNTLFKHTPTIKKSIKIIKNPKLQSVAFLQGLKAVNSSFYLHQNGLINLKGLEDLESVGASFSLSSNKISDLMPLKNLKKIDGMLGLAYNKLMSLDGLKNLKSINTIKWNDEYKSLTLHGNIDLIDLKAIKNLISSTKLMIISLNLTHKFIELPNQDSLFFMQDIEVYESNQKIDTTFFFPNYKKNKKIKILFANAWVTVLNKMDWLEPHFVDFDNVNYVIDYMKRHNITYLYAQVYNAQKFLFQNQERLKKEGAKFLVNDFTVMQLLLNKRKFFQFLIQNNLEDFIPKYYPNTENIEYPCVVKNINGTSGETVRIVYKKDELGEVLDNEVVNEYIVGNTEYAMNLFYKNGKIIEEITYKKSYSNTFYVLNKDTKYKMVDEVIANPYIALFTKILNLMFPNGGEILCCIDYKLQDDMPKIFEINVRLGYTLARNSYDFKKIIDKYILEIENTNKQKILFGDKWQNALSRCDWLDAHHKNFKNASEIIEYCKSNKIEILFANNFKTQLFLLINERILRNAGLKFIINNEHALKYFVNKQKFYDLMLQNELHEYVPKYYETLEDVQFPCMVKTKTGGAGRGVYLAYNKEEIDKIDNTIILSEYLKSNVEYATTIFYHDGKLLKDITYSKTALRDTYVLQQEAKDAIKVQREETKFLDLFIKIVEIFSGKDDYCACSINYKIENNNPKIFEINPRMGYTLSGFCDDFKEMMDIYVKELYVH